MIGAPADSAEPRFAAGRILTRHETNPCCEFPSGAKVTTVVNRSDERCCNHGPHAWQLRQPPAGIVRPAKGHELSVELVEPEIEGAELIEHVGEEFTCEIGNLGCGDGVVRLPQKTPRALGQNNAVLAKKSPHMIDERGSSTSDAVTC